MMNKIAIHSVPRSGSTWLGNIFNSHPAVNFSYQPLFSYAFKDYLDENSSQQVIRDFFNKIALSKDEFIKQSKGIEDGIIPKFIKQNVFTHICYKEVRYHYVLKNLLLKDSEIKVIGLIRNPFSTIYSWLNAPKEFRPDLGWKIEEEWRFAPKKNLNKREEYNGYDKWKEVAFMFLDLKKSFSNNFYLLNYDDLLIDVNASVASLFDFCDLKMETQTMDFINPAKKINQEDAYSVFKIRTADDGWMGKLPDYIVNEIKQDKDFIQLNSIFKWL